MTLQEMDCFFWAWATIQMLQDCAEWLEWEKIKFTQEKLCLKVDSIKEFWKFYTNYLTFSTQFTVKTTGPINPNKEGTYP